MVRRVDCGWVVGSIALAMGNFNLPDRLGRHANGIAMSDWPRLVFDLNAQHQLSKRKNQCGVSGINGCKAAPVLEF